MLGPLLVNFDHATRDGVVEGNLTLSDLDGLEVNVGDTIGVMDSGAGPYEADVIAVEGDRIRVRAPALGAPRSNPGLANADDLERWSGSPAARTELSELVRALLVDTPRVTDLTARTGRGVDLAGWDALVDGGPGTPYVPLGRSAWELGAGSDPRRKAQEDYRKRTEDPLGVDPAKTTFVFVTSRRWVGKHKWSQSKRDKGIWRDVRVLDADDLEGWLRCCRPAHVRFSERLGLRPREIKSLRLWWDRWSESTIPPLPPDLLLAGREGQADTLRDRLSGTASAIGIKASTRQEAMAFAAAALRTSEDTDRLSRSFVVLSAAAWDNSVSMPGRSVLIPTFEDADVSAAVRAGHHVVAPMGVDDPGQAIELARLGRSEARAAFRAIGIKPDKADRYAVRARRSLTSLRRALSANPRVARPGWAQGEDGDILAVLVLVGAWSDTREADQETVAGFVNRDYESVERVLRRWEKTGDPPFRRSGNAWRLSNPEDAWLLLRDQIIAQDLGRWRKSVLEVLGPRDPVRDLEPEPHFVAPIFGLRQRWSSDLRRGLAQGIALLAVSESTRSVGGRSGAYHAESLVEELLDQAGNDHAGKLWQQLSEVLPFLAEAAPRVFIDAVSRDSSGDEPVLAKMFADRDVFASSPHVGLLRALERLCWSHEHLPAAMDGLLRLAKIDPGGQYMSRPLESARMALWPCSPQTGTPLDRRMDTLDGLLERFPDMGKKLLLELVPRTGSHWTDSDRPRFRHWGPAEKPTDGEILQAIEAVKSRVASMETHSEPNPDAVSVRLEELVEAQADLFSWSPVGDAEREKIAQRRCQVVQELFDLEGTGAISRFAGQVDRPELVGEVVADRLGDKPTEDLLQLLTNEVADRQLALGWVKRMAEVQGTAWVGHLLGDTSDLGDKVRANILLYLPTGSEVWDLLVKENKGVRQSYWGRIGPQRVVPEDFDTYLDKLLENGRIRNAIQVSWTRSKEEPAELIENGTIERVLVAASKADGIRLTDNDVYFVGQLMDLLSPDCEPVAFLEARFFLRLQMAGRSPTGIYGRLQRDPSLFADLVCQVDGKGRERQQPDANRVNLPQGSAWTILQEWRVPPGYDSVSGDFDVDTLRRWVSEARRGLMESGLSDMGDAFVGELLSGSPTGRDGVWPAEPVRNLLEEIESQPMEDGLMSGALTRRGMTTHGLLEGGEQERGLAGLYREMAAKIDTKWLRAADVLRRMADHYEEEGRQRDDQAERRADSDYV